MTRRFRCTVEYDGTAFHGFQRQPGLETVQGVLERAITETLGETSTVVGAGRTDSGVHAVGQVVHFDTCTACTAGELLHKINDRLPGAVNVRNLLEVDTSFHARFSAKSREYRYLVESGTEADLDVHGRTHRISHALSVEAMDDAVSVLHGKHDFALFGSPMIRTVAVGSKTGPILVRGGTERTVWVANCWRQRRFIHFRFVADSFLRRMVRMIVGTLLRIGSGALKPRAISNLLQGDRSVYAGPAAPAYGLYLVHIRY